MSDHRPGRAEPSDHLVLVAQVGPVPAGRGLPRRLSRLVGSPIGTVVPILLALAIWQVASRLGFLDEVFFPPPTDIGQAFWTLLVDGDLLSQTLVTLRRVALGFLCGSIPAVVLGVAIARLWWVKALLDPLVSVLYPIPSVAYLPLLLVVLGLGSAPVIALAAILSFYPTLINTAAGIQQVDEKLLRMAKDLGASSRQQLQKLALPSAMPSIFAGLRLSAGAALLGVIVGEFVASGDGIGASTWRYWQIYQIKNMYGTLIVIAALGLGITEMGLAIQRRFFGWHEEMRRDME